MTGITIAGETFNVLIEGDENKEGLMLSNPMGTNLHLWDPQIPALAEHFRIVRYDSRGHGASVANQGPYSVESLGRDALAIMDALGIERVLVGQHHRTMAPGPCARAHRPGGARQYGGANTGSRSVEQPHSIGTG